VKARLGIGFLGALVVAILFGPFFLADPLAIDPAHTYAPISSAHWLGTDSLGRDVLARALVGGRVTLFVATLAALVSSGGGAVLGLVAGWMGGRVEQLTGGVIDAFLAVPRLPLMLLFVSADLGAPITRVVLAMIAFGWMNEAMIARASVRRLRDQELVLAARQLGYPPARILFHHVLPNIASPLIVATTLSIGELVLYESVLSFIGLGVPPPSPSWGAMMSEVVLWAPSLTIIPGLLVFLTIAAIQAVGDGLRDALDPKATNR
jgi:peptide/nickel transport system permease protein